jgi:hypothetical protein
MNTKTLLRWLLILISVATLASGLVQMVDPAFILNLISAQVTATTEQCFGIVGMFMTLFGGMLLQVLISGQPLAPVFLWAGLQKVGASAAVTLGVFRHLFSPLALGIAGFDLLSGILIFIYLMLLNRDGSAS